MTLSIDDLLTTMTEDQALEVFLSGLESLGLPARSWRVGGVARSILRVVASTYAGFSTLQVAAIRSGFLETAQGPWLTLLARGVYGVTRREATFATGQLLFTDTGGGVFSFGPNEVRAINPSSKKVYANADSFTLNPGEQKLVAIRAVEAGSASSAPPGAITQLETVLLKVVVSNPASVVGIDAETDEELRQRCRDKLGALSLRGPRGAYAYAVRSAVRADGSPVNVNRLSVSPSSSTGTVTVYVASPSGAPIADDLVAIRQSIEDIARPDSVTVSVLAATEVPIVRNLTVWAKRTDGVSAPDVQALVLNALVTQIAIYPIGGIPKPPLAQGYLYADFLASIATGAHPAVYDVDGEGDDIPLAPGAVATLAATVTVRIVEVS